MLAGCGPSRADLAAVDYAPQAGGVWEISTPAEQGLDPDLIAKLYDDASKLDAVCIALVFRNGYLIGERHFNIGSPEQHINIHSVTKSITSALVGIALGQGCLSNLAQKMIEFFPVLSDRIKDPRKKQITLREMLQMRAGYPWEESTRELFNLLFSGFRASTLVDVPLVRNPGTDFEYSNLTSHLMGIVVVRACKTDLRTFAEEHLFKPLGIEPGFWQTDWETNYLGFSDLHLSAVDLAKFGLMYLNDGKHKGKQIVPADWGHGGEQIALLDDLAMAIVVTVDPLHKQHGGGPWKIEKSNLNLAADFLASLPSDLD